MKLDTQEKKMAFIAGYIHAIAQQHAEEFGRDIEDVKKELLENQKIRGQKRIGNF